MPFGGFLALGIGSAVGSIAGGAVQAGAQEDIALAQQQAAQRMREEALKFAAPTAKELENLTKQTQLYEKMYGQQSAILEQAQKQMLEIYGPAIMEQGKQYYNQLRGEASGVVKSYDSQRTRQRDQLKSQLLERMGPDALTSSAGVQALNQFDTQTSEQRTSIEEQSLNQSLGRLIQTTGGQGGLSSMIGGAYNSMSGMLNQIQGTMNNFQSRQVNAANATSAAVISGAGAENVGQAYMGQAIQGGFQQAGQLAGQGLMMNQIGMFNQPQTQAPQSPGGTSGLFNGGGQPGWAGGDAGSTPFGEFNPTQLA